MKKSILLFIGIACFYKPAFSQVDTLTQLYKFTNNVNAKKTANSKDVLSNIFRASVANLLGKNKAFQFNSTFYAIDSVVNKNMRSSTDFYYAKQRALRGIQLNLAVKVDSSTNQLTDFSGGLTIALINKRDVTYADFSTQLVPVLDHFETLRKSINMKLAARPGVSIAEIQESWTAYSKSHDFADLDPLVKAEVNTLSPADQAFIKTDEPNKKFNDLTKLYARKSLLTLSPNYNYNRVNKQSSFALSAAYVVGISRSVDKKPWELEAKSSISIMADTTIAVANYKNRPFLISAGVNKVLREDADNASTMELKGFFQYDYQFGDKQPGVDAGKVTFNTTWRINLYKSIWLPVTLRYDVKNANIFGFLSLTANIDK
jgi:hypothetical protein